MTAGRAAGAGLTKFARAGTALVALAGILAAGVAPGAASAAPPTSTGAAMAELDAARVPVILVHGLASSPRAWRGTDFDRALRKEGYREGVNLFLLDYGDDSTGDYVALAESRLAPLVRDVLHQTGHARVDIVAHSIGGLIARAYMTEPERRRTVRTLVLIASPGHGSPAASLLKNASMVEDGWNPPPAHREHVEAVATGVFTPLLDRLIGAAQGGREEFGDPFALLREREPEVYFERFEREQQPIDGMASGPEFPLRPPDPRADLTRAYLNAIAFNRAVAGRLAAQPAAPLGDVNGPNATEAESAAAGRRFVLNVAERFGVRPDGVAIDRLVRRTLDVPAERSADGVRRFEPLLANYFLARWTDSEPAARTLAETVFTGASLPHPTPKYVVVAGAMPNLWRGFAPWVGDNDGVVEVRSAFIPQAEHDAFRLFTGPSAGHSELKQMPAVAAYVVEHLRDFFLPRRRHEPTPGRGWWRPGVREFAATEPVRRWEPTFVEVSAARLAGASGRITFEMRLKVERGAAPAVAPVAWAYLESPGGDRIERRSITLNRTSAGWQGDIAVEGFGSAVGRVWVGARTAAAAIGNRFTATTFREPALKMTYRVRWDPAHSDAQVVREGTPGYVVSRTGPPPGPPPGRSPRADEATSAAGGATDGATGNPGDEEIDPLDPVEAPPPPEGLIVVQRRTKRISRLEETRTVHERWEWDFGDGQAFTDSDSTHVRSTRMHTYALPGTYRVTATSWSNQGTVLRRQVWTVPGPPPWSPGPPPPAPVVHTFTAESITEPHLRFELDAPRKWVTGRPADVRAVAEADPPPFVDRVEIDVDPDRSFQVVWVRPGRFTVRVAAAARLTYRFPEGAVRIRNVYVREAEVEVATMALTP